MLIGRGGKRGKTSGRGTKGQNARAGRKKRPEIRDFIKRIPKLRGHGKSAQRHIGIKPFIVNLGAIEAAFENGAIVSPATLLEKKVVSTESGKIPPIKILGSGDFTKSVKVSGCAISTSAQEKIVKAGGSVESKVLKVVA